MTTKHNKRILVIDDDPMIVRLVELALKGNGFEIHAANNGRDGLKQAASLQPALIILDVMMPGGMDGYEVCRSLKTDPATETIKVLMFTAQGDIRGKPTTDIMYAEKVRERLLGLEMGANDFLSKPVKVRELIERVQLLLQTEVLV